MKDKSKFLACISLVVLFLSVNICDSQQQSPLSLSPQEREWLVQHPVLKIAGPKAFPPFHFYSPDNVLSGMAADYVRLVFNVLDLKMAVQPNLPWPAVLKRAEEKMIDVITCVAKTEEREKFLIFSDPLISFPLVIITKTTAPFIGGLDDLHGRKVTVVNKVSVYEWLKRDKINIDPLFVETPEKALLAVSLGRAEAHIENLAAASYLIQKNGLSNLKIAGPTTYGHYDLFIAFRNDWPELVPIFNKALASITLQQHLEIRNKWLSVRYDPGIKLKDVVLWILALAGLSAGGLVLFYSWNRRLKKEINERKKVENALQSQKNTLDSIFRVAPTGIGLVVDRMITQANDKICQITGYAREELINHSSRMLYPTDEEFDFVGAEKYRQISERGTGTVESCWQRKDNSIIDVLLSSTPVDVNDLSQGVTFTVLDITARKFAEKELIRSEERYRGIVEDQTEFICRFSPEGQITFVNSALCRFMGKKTEELVGKEFMQFLSDKGKSGFVEILRGLTPDSSVYTYENIGMRQEKREYWGLWTCRGIFNKGGGLIEIQAVGKDITQQKDLEEKLRQAYKMEAIGTLSGGIAHDFNNILGVILGNSELAISYEHEDAPNKEYIQEVITASTRARDLVNQLLTFSRKSDEVKKPIAIAKVVAEAMKLLRAIIPTSIEFQIDIAEGLPAIMANSTQINQVMMNLCKNAADAMSDRGGKLDIRLEETTLSEQETVFELGLLPGRFVKLTVSDTGEGMDAEHLKRIFDPYFTTKEVGKGTGLGLAVTHGIITNNSGGIKVNSQVGKGTVFEIFLPAIDRDTENATPVKKENHRGSESILIVDDELSLANLGKKRLERLGYRVEITTKPEEALTLIQLDPDKYDLVITDMTMPKMTGDKLTKEIITIRPSLPVILCTGYSEKINEERAKQIGVKKFILKPIQIQELAVAIRECLDN